MAFMTWIYENGLKVANIAVAQFSDTGRGILAYQDIEAGTPLVRVPEKLLLTRDVVADKHPYATSLTEHQALALFLAYHRQDAQSFWYPFINQLPQSYESLAMFLPLKVKSLLQRETQDDIEKQIYKMDADIEAIQTQALRSGLALAREDLLWAWCSVNTRCLTLHTSMTKPRPLNRPTIAMMPFLDFLNHSYNARTEAGLEEDGSYVIKTINSISANGQVFINYGPHDNSFLLREYGFTMEDNPYDHAVLDAGYSDMKFKNESVESLHVVSSLLEAAGYEGDYTVSVASPISFRLLTALRLRMALAENMALTESVHTKWLKTLYGETEMISSENEHKAINAMMMIASNTKTYVENSLVKAAKDDRSRAIRPLLESTCAALNACIDACIHYFD